jgi:hypothetical protein
VGLHEARRLLAEASRRGLTDALRKACDPERILFDRQLAIYLDKRRTHNILTGRRSGKSYFAAAVLLRGCIRHHALDVVHPYVAYTRPNAKAFFWPILKEMVRRCGIGISQSTFNESDLVCRPFPGGSAIRLFGADKLPSVERVRGGKYGTAVIDECGAIPEGVMQKLKETLRPGMADLNDQLYQMGTPGDVCVGEWYESTTGDRAASANGGDDPLVGSWAWTMFQNPHMPDAAGFAEALRAENRWTEDTPTYVREYLGLWSSAAERLVYPYLLERNGVLELPRPVGDRGWRFVVGVDPGQTQETGFVVVGAHAHEPRLYALHAEKASGLLCEDVATRVRELVETYRGAEVVLDTGGLGAQHAAELRRRFAIAVVPADKRERSSAVRMLSDDVRSGHVGVLNGTECDALRREWSTLVWDDAKLDHSKTQRDPATGLKMDHCSDAALYAFRRLRHYVVRPEPKAAAVGTEAWIKAEEERMLKLRKSRMRVA